MRQRRRWKLLWFFLPFLHLASPSSIDDDYNRNKNPPKSFFSPRMDYNQWKPLGRGDPLKNDPTFDYVPPVLDQVHYWMDTEPSPQSASESNKGTGKKTEILLLGVSSKKPASNPNHNHGQNQPSVTASDRRDTAYDSYSKYYSDKTTNYYSHHPNQRIARPSYFPSMTSQIIPSLMSFANQVLDRTVFSKGTENKMPFTVLMPPPMDTREPVHNIEYSEPLFTSPMTQRPFTPLAEKYQYQSTPFPLKNAAVTVQESNLVYQASSLGSQKEFEAVPSISWELPSTTEPIRSNFNNYYKFGESLSPPKSFIKIQFSPQNYSNKLLEASDSNHNINYVTPPPLDESKMTFKGHVSDDNDISDSYVKIEKPQAQMDHMGVEINNIHPMPIVFPYAEPFRAPNNPPRIDVNILKEMETMKPPPVTQSPVYTRPTNPVVLVSKNPVAGLLKKEHIKTDLDSANFIASSSSVTNNFVTTPKIATTSAPTEDNTIPPDEQEVSTIPPPSVTTMLTTMEPVTTMQTLTTDPLFKHYKQPMEPLRGPMYLIIQGHSKVKTYKPAKQIDGIMIQETNEIPYQNDQNIDYSIKHLHGYGMKEDFLKKADHIARQRQARTGNLQTLKHVVQTGLGAIDFSKEDAEIRSRSDIDLEEAELEAGYEVVDSKDVTSEKYHKGIVEEARKLS